MYQWTIAKVKTLCCRFCRPCFQRACDHSSKCPSCRAVRLHLLLSPPNTDISIPVPPDPENLDSRAVASGANAHHLHMQLSVSVSLTPAYHTSPIWPNFPLDCGVRALQVLHVGRAIPVLTQVRYFLIELLPDFRNSHCWDTQQACNRLSQSNCTKYKCNCLFNRSPQVRCFLTKAFPDEYAARSAEEATAPSAEGEAPIPLFVMSSMLPGASSICLWPPATIEFLNSYVVLPAEGLE